MFIATLELWKHKCLYVKLPNLNSPYADHPRFTKVNSVERSTGSIDLKSFMINKVDGANINVQGDLYLACEIFISEKAYNFSLDPYLEKSLGQS